MTKDAEPLTAEDLVVGATYRAKNPRKMLWDGSLNDRTILWRSEREVQYDGPAVPLGHRYPRVSVEKFLRWASHRTLDA